MKGTPKRTGRPPREIPLGAIRAQARLGQWKVRSIGRVLGIPHQTLFGRNREAVADAIEQGKAEFEADALAQYAQAIKDRYFNPLIIFKMKQLGWSDKLQHSGPGDGSIHLELEGAAERFLAQVEKYMKKQAVG